jgi:hypothetical protein
MQTQTYIKDYKPKAQKKYYRPYFSPITGSYEMDYVYTENTKKGPFRRYLTVININTRYLFFIPLELNTTQSEIATIDALKFINGILKENNQQITNLRSDADHAFAMFATDKTATEFRQLNVLKDNRVSLQCKRDNSNHHIRLHKLLNAR